MLERGHVSTFRQAFDKYIKRDGPAYVQRKKLTPIEALTIVLKAGGLPVLAHPADIRQLSPLLSKLRKAGMVGIEVYYNGYAPKTISYLEKMAAKHDLIACGGSDYHGPGETVGSRLGSIDVPREEVERLIALAAK
jgi:predicted metal-dependent phosphoesterase TrpH